MNQLNGKIALVTGGSRGFGRAIVEALSAGGATVHALARDAGPLDQLKQEVKGVQTRVADVSDPQLAPRILSEICPEILVLNAGASLSFDPLHEQSWEQFSNLWNTDVKATFNFGKEALRMPMTPVKVVVIVSSRAATVVTAQPVTVYGSAKRMQWFLAQTFQQEAIAMGLGIRFVVIMPRLTNQTEFGRASVSTFAAREGVSEQAYLERFGVPMTPEMVGRGVVDILTDKAYQDGIAFSFSNEGPLQPVN